MRKTRTPVFRKTLVEIEASVTITGLTVHTADLAWLGTDHLSQKEQLQQIPGCKASRPFG